jgi:tetratricopeptide (TPR) repeat protein
MPGFMKKALPVFAVLCLAFGDTHYFAIKEGNEKYRQKDFKGALELYKKANDHKDTPVSRYNMGNARYRLGDYNAAAQSYAGAVNAPDTELAKSATLNYANAKTALVAGELEKNRQGKDARENLESAIAAYRKILLDDPANQPAKHNMEIALKKLDELKDREKDEDKKEGKKDNKDGQGQDNKKEDKKTGDEQRQARREQETARREQVKKEEAEKLLKSLSNEEEKVQKQLRRDNMSEKEVEKDW